jgi:hypothetical protein
VGSNTFRRRVAAEDVRRNNLGLSPVVQANVRLVPEVSRLEFIKRSRRLLVVGRLRAKRAAKDNPDRACIISRPRRSKQVPLLLHPGTDNLKVDRESTKEERRLQDRNSSDDHSGSETRSSGAVFA